MDYVIAGTSETTFPVGDGTRYRPVYVTPVSGGSTYTAEFKDSQYGGGTGCVNTGNSGVLDHIASEIYWDVDNNGGANATIGLGWNSTIVVDVPADMRLSHWDGSAWEAVGETVTGTCSDGRVSGAVTSFSPFNLGSGSGNSNSSNSMSSSSDSQSYSSSDSDILSTAKSVTSSIQLPDGSVMEYETLEADVHVLEDDSDQLTVLSSELQNAYEELNLNR
jgi:hypothetical protein